MKKSILAVAGLAAVAGIAAPVAGAFATQPTSTVSDKLSITISETCAISRTSGTATTAADELKESTFADGTYSATMLAGKTITIGTSVFTTVCNDTTNGYKLTVSGLDNLTHTDESTKIAYSASTISDGTAAWQVTNAKDSGTAAVVSPTSGSADLLDTTSDSTKTATSGTTNTIVYKVGTTTTQKTGTYSGTVTYTLTYGAAE